MNITLPGTNSDLDIIHDFLSGISEAGMIDTQFTSEDIRISPPINCYKIEPEQAGTLPLDATALWGTRSYLLSDGKATMEIDVQINADGKHQVASVHPGAVSMHSMMKVLGSLPTNEGDFEVRLLFINQIHFVAAWLHGSEDLIIPIEPTKTDGVEIYHTYSTADFASVIGKAQSNGSSISE